jgi:hypothetical protein
MAGKITENVTPTEPWFMIMNTLETCRWIGLVSEGDEWERRLLAVRADPVTDWIPPPVEWLPETRNRRTCDFPRFWSNIWCVSRRARQAVGGLLGDSGEFLELSGLDGDYSGFHCLRTYDALDSAATELRISARPGIAFASPSLVPTLRHASIENGNVFRIRQSLQKVFVSQRFREQYDSAALTGLDFLPVPLS